MVVLLGKDVPEEENTTSVLEKFSSYGADGYDLSLLQYDLTTGGNVL